MPNALWLTTPLNIHPSLRCPRKPTAWLGYCTAFSLANTEHPDVLLSRYSAFQAEPFPHSLSCSVPSIVPNFVYCPSSRSESADISSFNLSSLCGDYDPCESIAISIFLFRPFTMKPSAWLSLPVLAISTHALVISTPTDASHNVSTIAGPIGTYCYVFDHSRLT